MPFMDGYESTGKIREYLFNKGIMQPIIIAVTGHTENQYIQRALNSGMNEVLFKPCGIDDDGKIVDKIGFLKKEQHTTNRLEGLI
jgi:CheY-like chemotaxis protein